MYDVLGITKPSQLFEITEEDLLKLDKFKDKKASKVIANIEKAKEIELFRFIYALSIVEVGIKTARELAKVESQKDFPQEAELQEKLKRLAEVDALLNMDKKDREGAELGEPDDGEMPQKKVVGLER